MAEREHDEQLAVPIYVDDDSVLTDSEFVGLYGAEPRQEPLWVGRRIVELASDSLFQVLVERAVLPRRKLGGFDPEGQAFSPLPFKRRQGTVFPARTWRRASKISSIVSTLSRSSSARARAYRTNSDFEGNPSSLAAFSRRRACSFVILRLTVSMESGNTLVLLRPYVENMRSRSHPSDIAR